MKHPEDKAVVDLFLEGYLTKDVIQMTGFGKDKIHTILRRNKIRARKGILNLKSELALIEDYKAGMKIGDLITKYQVSEQVVWNTLDRHSIPRIRQRAFTREEEEGMVDDYVSGMPISKIEKKYSCTRTKIYAELDILNLPRQLDAYKIQEQQESEIVSMYLAGAQVVEIYAKYGKFYKNSNFIYKILKKNGIKLTNHLSIQPSAYPEIVARYLDWESSVEIAHDYNCDSNTIIKVLVKEGVKIRNASEASRKYPINENYFETIDTPEKAYWLGFIFGDGCLSPECNGLFIGLQTGDIGHLEKFRKAIDSETRPIKIYKNNGYGLGYDYCKISIVNKKMAEDLQRHNVVKNKTKNLVWPETLPEHLISHFIRGKFDADGCLSIKNERKFYFCITSFKPFLEQLKQKLEPILDLNILVKDFYSIEESSAANAWVCGNKQIIKFIDWMYKDHAGNYLDRKYELYKKALTLYGDIKGSESMEEYLHAH